MSSKNVAMVDQAAALIREMLPLAAASEQAHIAGDVQTELAIDAELTSMIEEHTGVDPDSDAMCLMQGLVCFLAHVTYSGQRPR